MAGNPIKSSPGLSTNIPGNADRLPNNGSSINFGNTQRLYQLRSQELVQSRYNIGVTNPYAGPTARSLFYDASFLDYANSKYGQFLFYSVVGNNDPNFYENYYLSERTEYNAKVSETNRISGGSRNPSAGFLVRETAKAEASMKNLGPSAKSGIFNFLDYGSFIIGGLSAPYHWKDFLYCKYYGHIPNNYMVTLRRFPSPMKDNLSLPDKVKGSDVYKTQGAGRPVAQAVTWFGANTGNSLSDLLQVTAGLNWKDGNQAEYIDQEGFAAGLFKNQLGDILNGAFGTVGGSNGQELGQALQYMLEAGAASSDTGFIDSVAAARNKGLRDKAIQPGGPLSEFIWVSVDTVNRGKVRAKGVNGMMNTFNLKFHYELTSAGEVNSKAAMIDIIGNLLGLTTNYANFLTPEIRFNNAFPAVNFPGGDEGLLQFYSDPVKFVKTLVEFAIDPNQSTNGDPVKQSLAGTKNQVAKARDYWNSKISQMQGLTLKEAFAQGSQSSEVNNLVVMALTERFVRDIQFPASIYTGLSTGEWHLVIGNPCNPIAMIGNLICTGLDIQFSDTLGPDDFPTELIATITLEMARERERGEVESMFNRGEGRLYQSVVPVYSNTQSLGAFGTVSGNVITAPANGNTLDTNIGFGPQNSNEAYSNQN